MTDKFKKGSNDNVLFVTSACSNRCIMCCQPPKYCDDSEQLFQKNLSVIASADVDTDYVCITGGEPTLIGDKLFIYMHNIWERMPDAEIHLLTNGRKYADVEYLTAFVKNVKGNMVLGIPLHSDNPIDHDYIASAKDSFYETMKGLHNLGLLGFNIELRVILLQQNYQRLPKIAEFISLNLPFVSQVSIEFKFGCLISPYVYCLNSYGTILVALFLIGSRCILLPVTNVRSRNSVAVFSRHRKDIVTLFDRHFNFEWHTVPLCE